MLICLYIERKSYIDLNHFLILFFFSMKKEGPLNKGEQSFLEDERSVNFNLVVPTTPANVFHMYRRQISGNFRKPLVVGSAKTRKG